MAKAAIKLHFWDEPRIFWTGRFTLEKGDQVIVKDDKGNLEIGKVLDIVKEDAENQAGENELPSVIRKVNTDDLAKLEQYRQKEEEGLEKCRQLIRKHQLPMNLVDCRYSFDGGKITFTFTADNRVDFRNLVRDLSYHFQKSVRLQQIGIRDETKRLGTIGVCGRPLCCQTHLKQLGNVSSDLARAQQVAHRGSERISGACGRLMCCLAYEEELYKACSKVLPPIGSTIKTRMGKGEVVAWNILKQSVDVKIDGDTVIEEETRDNEECNKLQA